jgi:tetratricopeptide (TPR) repeat protein
MAIGLSNRRRRQFAVGVAVIGCVYVLLAAKEFAASLFAARTELSSLKLAVRLSPGNADYRHRLGRYLAFVAGDPQSAIDGFREAVELNPHDAHYWFDLAAAYQVTGDISGQRAALDRALIFFSLMATLTVRYANSTSSLRTIFIWQMPLCVHPGACVPTQMLCSATWCRIESIAWIPFSTY